MLMHKILQQTTAKAAAGVFLEFCKEFESFQEASENIQFTHLSVCPRTAAACKEERKKDKGTDNKTPDETRKQTVLVGRGRSKKVSLLLKRKECLNK